MAVASHVTRWGRRPLHFACCVALSARFGLDLDLEKLPAWEKAVCAGAINTYKNIRDVTAFGDLYRLENPHDTFRGAMGFVSPGRARAVVFVFQLQAGTPSVVRPQGLDPAKKYRVRELTPAAGRAALSQEGGTVTGEELMGSGLVPACAHAIEACVIEFVAIGGPMDAGRQFV